MASSRVGLRIRTFIVLVRGTAARASITGIENARVLPVPVCAVATTSRPSMSGGIACAWTGVGVTNSFLWRLFRNAEQRLSSEKCFINCVRFLLREPDRLSLFRIAVLRNCMGPRNASPQAPWLTLKLHAQPGLCLHHNHRQQIPWRNPALPLGKPLPALDSASLATKTEQRRSHPQRRHRQRKRIGRVRPNPRLEPPTLDRTRLPSALRSPV